MAPKNETVGDPLAQQIEFISNLFTNGNLRKKYLSLIIDNLKVWTGCECVGIRIIAQDGSMPYDSFVGFSFEFWENENWLSVNTHQCCCTRIATGMPDPFDRQILTEKGSLWTNDLSGFCKNIPETEASRYRCKCLEFGFASLAVIPLKHRGRVIGLIHLADSRKGLFPEDTIVLLESASAVIGEIIMRYRAEDGLKEKEETLRAGSAGIKACAQSILPTCNSAEQQKILAVLQEKIEALESHLATGG